MGAAWGRALSEAYAQLKANFGDVPTMGRAAESGGIPPAIIRNALVLAREDSAVFLYELLRGDERVHALRAAIGMNPMTLDAACKTVFDDADDESLKALVALVALCAAARPAPDAMPLVPARYHLFARRWKAAMSLSLSPTPLDCTLNPS